MLLPLAERCLQSSCRKALSKQELPALGEVEGFCGGECACGPKVISDISRLYGISARLHYGGDPTRRQRTCLSRSDPPRFSQNSDRNATAGRAGAVTLLATLCARISFHLCFPQSPTTCLGLLSLATPISSTDRQLHSSPVLGQYGPILDPARRSESPVFMHSCPRSALLGSSML